MKASVTILHAATAEDTLSGTNKKELELEVYSEGFVYTAMAVWAFTPHGG